MMVLFYSQTVNNSDAYFNWSKWNIEDLQRGRLIKAFFFTFSYSLIFIYLFSAETAEQAHQFHMENSVLLSRTKKVLEWFPGWAESQPGLP